MEAPKRKYKKHKTEKVISVSHYLNKRLKGKIIDGELSFPLYIQINYNGQTTNIKSRLDKYVSEVGFEEFKLEFKSELNQEKATIKKSLERRSESEERAKASHLVQGLKALKQSIDQSLVLEMKFIIASRDEDALNFYVNREYKDSNLYRYMVSLTTISRHVMLINWNEFEVLLTLEMLIKLMPNNTDLKELYKSLNLELSFEEIYEQVSNKYFKSQPKLEDWRTGKFQDAIKREYEKSPYSHICNQYILFISNLLTSQERL